MARILPLAAVAAAAWPAPAFAADTYERCPTAPGTTSVAVARTSCGQVAVVAAALGAARTADTSPTLVAAGWTPLRAAPADGGAAHDVVALRGQQALLVRRAGAPPDIDGFMAGRELLFARGTIVGGRPVPRGAATCTSAFLVRLRGGRTAGLSAAHCAGLRSDRRVHRRNVAMRRPPLPGIVLGRVVRILTRSAPLDAVAVSVPGGTGRTAAPVVDRGIERPPWIVARSARALPGREVCFSGRTSGPDRCGRIRGRGLSAAETLISLRTGLIVRCTTIRARQGDSGGPVFTKPRSDGTVRALGIVTLVVGARSRMCFTPLRPALPRLHAFLVTG